MQGQLGEEHGDNRPGPMISPACSDPRLRLWRTLIQSSRNPMIPKSTTAMTGQVARPGEPDLRAECPTAYPMTTPHTMASPPMVGVPALTL